MFNDTPITVLDSKFNIVKTIFADMQGYSGSAAFDYGVTLELSKRVFCSPFTEFTEDVYFRIGEKLYKPICAIEWDSYMEIRLYRMRRQNVTNTIDGLFEFFLFDAGAPVTINGASSAAVVLDADKSLGEYDDKNIMVKSAFKTGDVVEYQGGKHLVFSQVEKKTNSYAARLRRCNHHIAFNYKGDVQWFDVFIEAKVFDIEEGKVISLPQGNIIVWVQENDQSTKVALNQRFINTGRAWQITGIDRTKPGLMRLYCELTVTTADDDMVHEIADYYKYAHHYAISISNQQPVEVVLGGTTQLIFTVTDNGAAISTLPAFTCTSSNEAIATVSNTGLITGVANGEATITVAITGYPDTAIKISAKVTGTVTPSYSVAITFKNTAQIKVGGFPKPFTAVVYENGTAITTKSVTWSVKNKDYTGDSMTTLSDMTGTACKLAALDNTAYIGHTAVLTATLADDSTVFFNLDVLIISYT
ncbi:Ig-like domain-containing protein [Caproiciproducens sp. R1]|uniref:Ig-like domain-containing protein n=1 Tax=Caproiciproducens sp. R1 TaxID=3435000 RepID=UPI0040347580